MQRSLIFRLFQSLNPKELRDLKRFVRSPFHNKREDVIALFDFLAKQWPYKPPDKLKKELVFKQLFPRKAFDKKYFYHLCSFLKKIVEDYLIYQGIQSKKVKREIVLLQMYRQKGLARHFEETTQNAIRHLEKDALRNADYHYHSYQLYQ